ncbi:MAG: RidA family protein [Candidatus Egerieousia sp.]
MKKTVASPKAPKAIGTYSQAIIADNTIYVSGQLPIDPATGEMPAEFKAQAAQSFRNLKNILEDGGFAMSDVVKVTVYLQDLANFAALNEVYTEFFSEPYPARVAFQAAALPKGALIEADAIAVKA